MAIEGDSSRISGDHSFHQFDISLCCHAYKYFIYGVCQDSFPLFQVAHFYNTIDQQMIPSQQAMMLEAAMAFEHLIKNPKAGSKAGE